MVNQVDMTWDGAGGSFRIVAGTSPGSNASLSVDVNGNSYTWMAPRDEAVYYVRVASLQGGQTSAFTSDFPVYTIDLRNVIDALFFRSGPMSDSPNNALGNPPAAVWAPGTRITGLVSNEAGESARAGSQQFMDEYADLSGGAITGTNTLTDDTFRTTTLGQVPEFHIYTRVLSGYCGINVIACAFYGPAPVGPNRSIVTQNGAGGSVASLHELGHAYGLGHVRVSGAVRAELNFLMNPVLLSSQLTEPEKNAIRSALSGGIGAGTTRNQALALGLVLPFPPSTSYAPNSASMGPREPSKCVVEGR
jgi:hypothetical protein